MWASWQRLTHCESILIPNKCSGPCVTQMPLELFSHGLIRRPSERGLGPGASCLGLGHGLEASRPLCFHVYNQESSRGWVLATHSPVPHWHFLLHSMEFLDFLCLPLSYKTIGNCKHSCCLAQGEPWCCISITTLNPQTALGSSHPLFIDEETEVQRGRGLAHSHAVSRWLLRPAISPPLTRLWM